MAQTATAARHQTSGVTHRLLLVYLGSIAVVLFSLIVFIAQTTVAPVKQRSEDNATRIDRTDSRIERRLDRIESGVNELRNGLLKK